LIDHIFTEEEGLNMIQDMLTEEIVVMINMFGRISQLKGNAQSSFSIAHPIDTLNLFLSDLFTNKLNDYDSFEIYKIIHALKMK